MKNAFPLDATFSSKTFDIVNGHPLPNTQFDGQVYGGFMSKELRLDQVAGFCRATVRRPKPVVLDEDNTASMYRDTTGWTIHRNRAWAALLSGCHYDYIDFSITVGSERGTVASQSGIRTWMQHLSEFMASFDYTHAKLAADWVAGYPPLRACRSAIKITWPTWAMPASSTILRPVKRWMGGSRSRYRPALMTCGFIRRSPVSIRPRSS